MDTIGIYGRDNYDFVIYFSDIIRQTGKKVLVADATEDGTLDRIITGTLGMEASSGLLNYYGTDYFRLGPAGKDSSFRLLKEEILLSEHDYVIFVFDSASPSAKMVHPMKSVFITNQEYPSIEAVNSCINIFSPEEMPKTYIVYRDIYSIGISPEKLVGTKDRRCKTESYCFRHDETDGALKALLGYHPKKHYGRLSKEYRNTLLRLVSECCPDCSEKKISRLMKG